MSHTIHEPWLWQVHKRHPICRFRETGRLCNLSKTTQQVISRTNLNPNTLGFKGHVFNHYSKKPNQQHMSNPLILLHNSAEKFNTTCLQPYRISSDPGSQARVGLLSPWIRAIHLHVIWTFNTGTNQMKSASGHKPVNPNTGGGWPRRTFKLEASLGHQTKVLKGRGGRGGRRKVEIDKRKWEKWRD